MKVLIACEYSGTVRDAFTAQGHDATSCDLLPTETPGKHYQGNVTELLFDRLEGFCYEFKNWDWDLIIAHPPCTYLSNSGVRWLYTKEGRRHDMNVAATFFKWILELNYDKIAIENPIPHKYALEIIGRKYDQIIQPWQFGHGETKSTCLWLKGLPKLKPTNIVEGREQNIWKMPPSKDRAKLRSKTFQGIAEAMAMQWGAINN